MKFRLLFSLIFFGIFSINIAFAAEKCTSQSGYYCVPATSSCNESDETKDSNTYTCDDSKLMCCGPKTATTPSTTQEEESASNETADDDTSSTCESGETEGFGPFSYSGSIVPCGKNCDDPSTADIDETKTCTLCHILILFQRVFNLITALLIIATIGALTIAGMLYILSGANASLKSTAKGIITKSLTGFALFLTAWLIVLTVLNFISVKSEVLGKGGNWYEFICDTDSVYDTLKHKGGESGSTAGSSSSAGTTPSSSSNSVGCGKVVDAANAIYNENPKWQYSQPLRGQVKDGIHYTDCSHYVSTCYSNSNCSKPGSTTADMYAKAESFSGASDLKKGDLLVHRSSEGGHVVMCMSDGCSNVIHASGVKDDIKISNGSYYYSNSKLNTKVLRASKYCTSCSS